MRLLTTIIGVASIAMATAVVAEDTVPEDAGRVIEYLLDCVAKSDLEFVRNGKVHTGEKAAGHMRRKYEHFADRIETPEDFIDLAATKSLISGKLYTVRTADGEIPTADWLRSTLADYRAATESGTI